MTRTEAREHLQMGAQLDGLVLTKEGVVLARGKVQWEGTVWSATRHGRAVSIQLSLNGDKLEVPLVEPVLCEVGKPVEVKFGPDWRG